MSDLPIDAWSGSDSELMAEQRAERWRLRYEGALEVDAYLRKELKDSRRQTREALESYEKARAAIQKSDDHAVAWRVRAESAEAKLARVEKIWEAWTDDPDPMVQALLRHIKGALDE